LGFGKKPLWYMKGPKLLIIDLLYFQFPMYNMRTPMYFNYCKVLNKHPKEIIGHGLLDRCWCISNMIVIFICITWKSEG
jgi:hypothetical protein